MAACPPTSPPPPTRRSRDQPAAPALLGAGGRRAYREVAFHVTNLPAGTTSVTVVIRAGDTAGVLDLDWFV